MPVLSQKSEHSCICVLWYRFSLFLQFRFSVVNLIGYISLLRWLHNKLLQPIYKYFIGLKNQEVVLASWGSIRIAYILKTVFVLRVQYMYFAAIMTLLSIFVYSVIFFT